MFFLSLFREFFVTPQLIEDILERKKIITK